MASVGQKLLRNTLWVGGITVFGIVSGIVTSVLLARHLGPALMGDFSYLTWAARTIEVVALLAFPVTISRYAAAAWGAGTPELAWGIARFIRRRQAIGATIVAASVVPIVFAWAPSNLRLPFLIVLLATVPAAIERSYTYSLYAAQRYDLTAMNSAVKMTLQFTAIVAALSIGAGITGIVLGTALPSLVCWVLQRRQAHRVYPTTAAVDVPEPMQREIVRFMIPLSVVLVLDAIVWDRSEVFFLRLFTTPQEIAFYTIAFGLATKAMLLPEVGVGALLPAFSTLHGRGVHEEFATVYRNTLRYLILAAAPTAAVAAALAPGIVTFLYGEPYLPAAPLFRWMTIIAVVNAARKVAWVALTAVGDQRAIATVMVVSTAVNLAGALLLIPAYGTTGALVANALAQLTAATCVFFRLATKHRLRTPVADLAKIAVGAALAFGLVRALPSDSGSLLPLIAGSAAGYAVFIALALATRLVGADELRFALNALRRRVTHGAATS